MQLTVPASCPASPAKGNAEQLGGRKQSLGQKALADPPPASASTTADSLAPHTPSPHLSSVGQSGHFTSNASFCPALTELVLPVVSGCRSEPPALSDSISGLTFRWYCAPRTAPTSAVAPENMHLTRIW